MKRITIEAFAELGMLFLILWLAHAWSNRPSEEERREQILVSFALKG